MTHDELVAIAVRWLRKSARKPPWWRSACGVIVPECHTWLGEIPDVYGMGHRGYSCVIECKTSRADFLRDSRKPRFRADELGAGHECLYLAPAGVIRPDELPAHWGLLELTARNRVVITRAPRPNTARDLVAELELAYSLLRRVHLRGNLKACFSRKWGGSPPGAK